MNVYIESNFILELAFFQKKHEDCEKILTLAEEKKINLILPSFCISECYDAIKHTISQKNNFKINLKRFKDRFDQSTLYVKDSDAFEKMVSFVDRSIEVERESLNSTMLRLMKICTIIPMNYYILDEANRIAKKHNLKEPDAIVYASVLNFLIKDCKNQSCFLNKNSRDFNDPDIIEELNALKCEAIFEFTGGYQYILNQLKKS